MEKDQESSLLYSKNYDKCQFFIRHGERQDRGKTKEKNGKITEKGVEQALRSGDFIAKSLMNHPSFKIKTDSVIIYSSPYIRCLETSIFIAKSLLKNNINVHNSTIYKTSFLKEYQKKSGDNDMTEEMWNNDLNLWIPENQNTLEGVRLRDSECQQPKSETSEPKHESESDSEQRIKEFIDKQQANNYDGNQGKVVICCTHAVGLKRSTNLYKKDEKNCTFFDIKYCCITSLYATKDMVKTTDNNPNENSYDVALHQSNYIGHYKDEI